eukprot:338922_1
MERVREYDEREELEDMLCDKNLNELINDELIDKDDDGYEVSTPIGQGRAFGKALSQNFDELIKDKLIDNELFDDKLIDKLIKDKFIMDRYLEDIIYYCPSYGERLGWYKDQQLGKELLFVEERAEQSTATLIIYDELIRDKLIQAEGIDDEFIFELLNVSFIILFGGLNNCSGSSHGRNIYNEPTIEILLIIVLKVTLPPINEQKSDGIFILLTENYIKFEYMVIDIIILLIEVLIWIEVKIPSKYYGLIDEEDAVSQNGSERQNLVRRKLIVCVMEFIKIKVMLFITLVIILFKIFTTATCTSERSNLFDELVDDELIDEEESDGKGVVGLGEEEAVFGEEIMTLFDELVYDELIDNNNDEVIILLNGYLINPTLITTSEENKLGDDLLGILFGGIACAILLLTIILNENNNIGRDKYKESTIVRTHWA